MDKIKISVSGNIAVVAEKPKRITSGTTGLPVEFTFDSEWDELRKVAVFDSCCVRKDMIIKDGATVVPIENLAKPGAWLRIGVYGVNEDGSVAIPTIWANVGLIQPGAVPEGDIGTDVGLAKEQYDAAVLAADRAEAAASKAETDAGSVYEATFRAEAAMVTAESASESAHQSAQRAGASEEYIDIQKYKIDQSVAEAKNAQHYAEEAADRAEAATVSPTITVGEIEGGHQVTITDIDGEKSFDVMDGVDGKPGEKGDPGAKGDRGEKGETGNSGVYLGSGEMPDDCNVQIDPDGEPIDLQQEIEKAISAQEKHYELIETITLTEDTGTIERTKEPPERGGTPYSFDAVMVKCEIATAPSATYVSIDLNMSKGGAVAYYVKNGINTKSAKYVAHTYSLFGKAFGIYTTPVPNDWDAPNEWIPSNYGKLYLDFSPISRVRVDGGGDAVFPAGSVIEIWGVRANA